MRLWILRRDRAYHICIESNPIFTRKNIGLFFQRFQETSVLKTISSSIQCWATSRASPAPILPLPPPPPLAPPPPTSRFSIKCNYIEISEYLLFESPFHSEIFNRYNFLTSDTTNIPNTTFLRVYISVIEVRKYDTLIIYWFVCQ